LSAVRHRKSRSTTISTCIVVSLEYRERRSEATREPHSSCPNVARRGRDRIARIRRQRWIAMHGRSGALCRARCNGVAPLGSRRDDHARGTGARSAGAERVRAQVLDGHPESHAQGREGHAARERAVHARSHARHGHAAQALERGGRCDVAAGPQRGQQRSELDPVVVCDPLSLGFARRAETWRGVSASGGVSARARPRAPASPAPRPAPGASRAIAATRPAPR